MPPPPPPIARLSDLPPLDLSISASAPSSGRPRGCQYASGSAGASFAQCPWHEMLAARCSLLASRAAPAQIGDGDGGATERRERPAAEHACSTWPPSRKLTCAQSQQQTPAQRTHRLLAGCHSIRTTTTMDMSSKQIAIGFPAAAGLRLGSARAAASWSAERRRALTFWAIFPHIRRGGGRRRSAALCSRPGAAKSGSRPCVNLKPEA